MAKLSKMTYKYNNIEIEYFIANNNCQIKDSYKIRSYSFMIAFINYLRLQPGFEKRSVSSYLNEWKAHNLLYSFGLYKDRTRDTDLNINEYWYRKLAYTFIAPFYKLDK